MQVTRAGERSCTSRFCGRDGYRDLLEATIAHPQRAGKSGQDSKRVERRAGRDAGAVLARRPELRPGGTTCQR